jgi:ferric-dicitrate binding protein FerR (iron transport regulator)
MTSEKWCLNLIQINFTNPFNYISKRKKNVFSLRRTDWLGYTVKAVAAVFVILTASLFTMNHQQYLVQQVVESEPVVFQTEDEEHRTITLGDGTLIRMNSNSELVVSPSFMKGTREITLTGEAYFEVEHNPEQPFIIYANQSKVKVLGTAFNLRSVENHKNVQVAVIEGRVAFQGETNGTESDELSVILSKNQYGYLDLDNRLMKVDDKAVENYLAWKSGRFNFKELSLENTCIQLNRIYGTDCSFDDSEIRSLKLTANFTNESLNKTLNVIAMTLEVEYELRNDQVNWIL